MLAFSLGFLVGATAMALYQYFQDQNKIQRKTK